MSDNKQQTAVEWIETLFYSESKQVGFDRWVILESDMDRIINKAKEIEKEQIKDAYYNGTTNEIRTKEELLFEAEHFYNETYGGNK
jgi:hypothetical protein